MFARIAKTNPRVSVVVALADGDFVFGHTGTTKARAEWIAAQHGGRPTGATDLERTEANRDVVRRFVEVFCADRVRG